ncbi:MAG TPA: PP2C family protein-serine/threonine phosphatase [Candidatus Acidoferrales bacterium]|nr:PP2C family protein-serine/threonine phosphatase [Candidatus Acidoferrales bacterium]
MAFPTPKFLFRSTGVRAFLARQVLLFVVAAALFAILWVTGVRGPGLGFVPILLYGLFIGNFTTPIMNRVNPLSARLRPPFDWVVFLIFLFLTAVAGTALTVLIIMAVYRIPIRFFFPQLWSTGRLIVLVILIVGSIRYLYKRTRVQLEGKNLELQRAVEIGNTRSKQQEQEMDKAREIQEGLLPKKIPQVRGLEVAGAWQPASVVGGDYFDVLKFSDTKIGICIGDVVGKGISAALLMANLQASFRAFASEDVSAGTLVGKLNDVVANNIAADKFVTFCYCTIDTTENRLTYASAGHWPPILFHKSGEGVSLREGGAPLGIFPNRNYEDTGLPLDSGDRLVLYTDGLTEAMDSDEREFGERRLVELVSRNIALSAAELLAAIRKEVVGFCNGNFHDDFTLVVVAVK